jgi:hypothetical protein
MVNDQPNIIKKSLPVNIVILSTNLNPLSLPPFSGAFLSLEAVKLTGLIKGNSLSSY